MEITNQSQEKNAISCINGEIPIPLDNSQQKSNYSLDIQSLNFHCLDSADIFMEEKNEK